MGLLLGKQPSGSSWGCGFLAGLGEKGEEKQRAEREPSRRDSFLAAARAHRCSALPSQQFHRQCSQLNQFSLGCHKLWLCDLPQLADSDLSPIWVGLTALKDLGTRL